MDPVFLNNNTIQPPHGWTIAEEPEHADKAGWDMETLNRNLPLACNEAIALIDQIQTELNVHIPEAYLRVEEGKIFHILLLTSQEDFLSPKILAAKILTEECSKTEDRFDIRFSFTNLEENTHKNVIIEHGYRLKHRPHEDEPVFMDPKGVS